MQKTTRLVAACRRTLLGMSLACILAMTWLPTTVLAQETANDEWGDKTPPKNYVRSREPSKDGNAYNWTQMAYAGAFMCLVGIGVVVLVRRSKREQDKS